MLSHSIILNTYKNTTTIKLSQREQRKEILGETSKIRKKNEQRKNTYLFCLEILLFS